MGEAGEKSGTLITARLALEFNRDVFVIPGDISRSTSMGANGLIRDGLGKLIISAEDILNEYHLQTQLLVSDMPRQKPVFDDILDQSIYDLLEQAPLDASAISIALDVDASIVLYRASMMEVSGYVMLDSGGEYRVC